MDHGSTSGQGNSWSWIDHCASITMEYVVNLLDGYILPTGSVLYIPLTRDGWMGLLTNWPTTKKQECKILIIFKVALFFDLNIYTFVY